MYWIVVVLSHTVVCYCILSCIKVYHRVLSYIHSTSLHIIVGNIAFGTQTLFSILSAVQARTGMDIYIYIHVYIHIYIYSFIQIGIHIYT